MNICVIPARGGSKRIPRKNILEFCGRPMISWSIDAANTSACFDRIIVSTDDIQIADVAKKHGAEVPFIRPSHLADDYAGTAAVVAHAVDWMNQRHEPVGNACCVYATAPFVSADDLKLGLATLEETGCSYTFSVTSYAFPIQRAIRITPTNRVEMFSSKYMDTRSQDLEDAYHDAGQFYWGTANAWLNKLPIFSNDTAPVILPRHRVQDIDTLEDWTRAEWLFRAMLAGKS